MTINTKSVNKEFMVPYRHLTYFTENVFSPENSVLKEVLTDSPSKRPVRVLVVLDDHLVHCQPELKNTIQHYFENVEAEIDFRGQIELPGGEVVKNDRSHLKHIFEAIEQAKLCRHSYLIAIGGGAILDMVGFAAATAHRGIRLLRLPTTSLSQGDGGVGVKNSINYFGKKNFLGTFAPAYAIINDFNFLKTLPQRQLRDGYIEAVKVALIRDREFFDWIESKAEALGQRQFGPITEIIERSARHHIDHIVHGGDPFELTSARPLDFGHWVAHKLETMTDFRLSHGEAVAIGVAVDVIYCKLIGRLPAEEATRILTLVEALGFSLYVPELLETTRDGRYAIIEGLDEFREHLGGELSISLLDAIGESYETHTMKPEKIIESLLALQKRAGEKETLQL